jgi:hypothetical protein
MAKPRALTDAAALKQLKALSAKISTKAAGKQRLEMLRRQAELGDQRDLADKKARRASDSSRPG